MAFDPPPGYDDMLTDAEHSPINANFHVLQVDDEVGDVKARKPMPNAIPVMAMAANSKLKKGENVDFLVRFVQDHLDEGEFDRLIFEMSEDALPADTMERTARAIATWGTARPTVPSSH